MTSLKRTWFRLLLVGELTWFRFLLVGDGSEDFLRPLLEGVQGFIADYGHRDLGLILFIAFQRLLNLKFDAIY